MVTNRLPPVSATGVVTIRRPPPSAEPAADVYILLADASDDLYDTEGVAAEDDPLPDLNLSNERVIES